jgi:enhancer of polycomb-like protein
VIREDEIDELPEDEAQRNIPQFETGVEKAEEVVSTHPLPPPALVIIY